MKFVATEFLGRFNIHFADDQSEKPGEPVASIVCVDEDGDKMPAEFYASDALDSADVELLKAILAKLGAHAVQTFKESSGISARAGASTPKSRT